MVIQFDMQKVAVKNLFRKMKKSIIYDGAKMCHEKGCCPVIQYDAENERVTINDPSKPENGSFSMSVKEYNLIIENAKPIE